MEVAGVGGKGALLSLLSPVIHTNVLFLSPVTHVAGLQKFAFSLGKF